MRHRLSSIFLLTISTLHVTPWQFLNNLSSFPCREHSVLQAAACPISYLIRLWLRSQSILISRLNFYSAFHQKKTAQSNRRRISLLSKIIYWYFFNFWSPQINFNNEHKSRNIRLFYFLKNAAICVAFVMKLCYNDIHINLFTIFHIA